MLSYVAATRLFFHKSGGAFPPTYPSHNKTQSYLDGANDAFHLLVRLLVETELISSG